MTKFEPVISECLINLVKSSPPCLINLVKKTYFTLHKHKKRIFGPLLLNYKDVFALDQTGITHPVRHTKLKPEIISQTSRVSEEFNWFNKQKWRFCYKIQDRQIEASSSHPSALGVLLWYLLPRKKELQFCVDYRRPSSVLWFLTS